MDKILTLLESLRADLFNIRMARLEKLDCEVKIKLSEIIRQEGCPDYAL